MDTLRWMSAVQRFSARLSILLAAVSSGFGKMRLKATAPFRPCNPRVVFVGDETAALLPLPALYIHGKSAYIALGSFFTSL